MLLQRPSPKQQISTIEQTVRAPSRLVRWRKHGSPSRHGQDLHCLHFDGDLRSHGASKARTCTLTS